MKPVRSIFDSKDPYSLNGSKKNCLVLGTKLECATVALKNQVREFLSFRATQAQS